MAVAIVAYLVVGLLVGLVVRMTRSEESSLAGLVGGGGAGGLMGGLVANVIFSDGVALDVAGWIGSVVLAIAVVLVMRTRSPESTAT